MLIGKMICRFDDRMKREVYKTCYWAANRIVASQLISTYLFVAVKNHCLAYTYNLEVVSQIELSKKLHF